MYNTHYLTLYTTSPILYLEQQHMYAMRCTTVTPVEARSHVGCHIQYALFFLESKTNLFVHNRKLTDNYRNFTYIRTYFIVVQQQHSSSKTTQTERVGFLTHTHTTMKLQ